jgi:hypothetical protein
MLLTLDQQDQQGAGVVFGMAVAKSAVLAYSLSFLPDSTHNFSSIYCIRDRVTLHVTNVKVCIC